MNKPHFHRKFTLALRTFVLSIVIIGFSNRYVQSQTPPDFTLYDLDSNAWNLYSLLGNGKTVLLDFFFAACVPCQTYTPEIEQLYADYGSGTSDLIVLGISDRDNNATLSTFVSDYNVSYPVGGTMGTGNLITVDYSNWFSFSGWPTYGVVCTDTTIFWGLSLSIGMADLRSKIDTCDIVTSSPQFELNKSELDIHVYPQPADRSLFIKVYSVAMEKVKIKILNLLGEVVEESALITQLGIGSVALNTSKLNSGVYVLQVLEPGKTMSNTRIVVTH